MTVLQQKTIIINFETINSNLTVIKTSRRKTVLNVDNYVGAKIIDIKSTFFFPVELFIWVVVAVG